MTADSMACPFCGEEIKAEAKKCKHCGEFLPGHSRMSVLASLLRDVVEFITTSSTRRRQRNLLVEEMGSQEHQTAIGAVSHLRAEGWLEDGSLEEVDLRGANLDGADMAGANLKAANLSGAHLRGANLEGAWLGGISGQGALLEGADLRSANLRRALLAGANLRRADLRDADLRDAFLFNADLEKADLRGANLLDARLEGVRLEGANLDGATLPEPGQISSAQQAQPQVVRFDQVPRRRARKIPEGWRVVLVPWEADLPVIALELWGDAEIGRGYGSDIDLLQHHGFESGVSRRHAQLGATPSGLFLNDLGSSNGTYVNANRIEAGQPLEVHDGDIVRFGLVSFDVHIIHRPALRG